MIDTHKMLLYFFKTYIKNLLLELKYIEYEDLTRAEKSIKKICEKALSELEELENH